DVFANITFYRYEDDRTGKKIGNRDLFYMEKDDYVRAHVDLGNLFLKSNKPQMFHIEWIDREGHAFYMKREDLHPEDSISYLYSSISSTPDREAGRYGLKVYHFRELIAEKYFNLIPDSLEQTGPVEGITGCITLCQNVNRKTGERTGIDSVFRMGKKRYVRAFCDLENRFFNDDLVLDFEVEWIGPDGEPVYTKDITLKPENTDTFVYSSISIPEGKRDPGEYLFRVLLFDRLLAEQKFELQ
ncbi:MAG: hypothetical protein KDC05_11535, partial [Bacteroidales bacterium]|nr:hypothetical protein [Bacteroidales bacterium]